MSNRNGAESLPNDDGDGFAIGTGDEDFLGALTGALRHAGGLTGDRPALVLVLQFEDDPCLFQLTREPEDFIRLAEFVQRDSVIGSVMYALEDFASQHLADADIPLYLSEAQALAVRLEILPRLAAIVSELDRLDADVDVPRTIAEGLLEDVEELLAQEAGGGEEGTA